jgi:hypothetical protein
MPATGYRLLLSISALALLQGPTPADARQNQPGRGPAGLSAPINGLVNTGGATQASWSLPICGQLSKLESTSSASGETGVTSFNHTKELKGRVSLADGTDPVAHQVNQLLDTALERDPQTQVLEKAVAHYRTVSQRVLAQAKDAADFTVPYRGFGPSSEAGDIVLDEKIKLKSRSSAEYARQKHIDELHVKIVASVMQIAMGMGMTEKARGQQVIASGANCLAELVGQPKADETVQTLSNWSKQISVPESVYKQGVWDVNQRRDKFKTVVTNALDNDPVVSEIQKRIHKYNHRSNFARVSAHVVETALGIGAMAPEFVGPAAKAALITFIMATGGPEQSKLLKELYLDKRFESRWKVLTEEAHLALENYHVAILTRNPVLLACSESLVKDMTGAGTVTQLFGQSVIGPNAAGSACGAADSPVATAESTTN